jgi:hypothetical protein
MRSSCGHDTGVAMFLHPLDPVGLVLALAVVLVYRRLRRR